MEELKSTPFDREGTTAEFSFDCSYCILDISDTLTDRICKDFAITAEEFERGFTNDSKCIHKRLIVSYMADRADYVNNFYDVKLSIVIYSDTSSDVQEEHYYLDDESKKLSCGLIDEAEDESMRFMEHIAFDRKLEKAGFYDCEDELERLDILEDIVDSLYS